MSKRTTTARHRATPAGNVTLDALSKAVSANAGAVGRQAAVIAATSGLVLTIAAPAQSAPTPTARETSVLPAAGLDVERAVQTASIAVPADADVVPELERLSLESKAAPVIEEPEVEVDLAPVTQQNVNQSNSGSSQTTQAQPEAVQTASNETSQAAAEPAPAPQNTASGAMSNVVAAAYSGIGVPYVWGGKGPGGWDCSGFTSWAYAQAGINIPSSTSAIRGSGKFVRTSNPQPGDLVFQNGGSHVGIYVGNGQMIGAQNPSVGTLLHNVSRNPLMGYYTYVG